VVITHNYRTPSSEKQNFVKGKGKGPVTLHALALKSEKVRIKGGKGGGGSEDQSKTNFMQPEMYLPNFFGDLDDGKAEKPKKNGRITEV